MKDDFELFPKWLIILCSIMVVSVSIWVYINLK
jgi:hypothetical protein